MKTLVIYDSLYGNTRTIAQTIANAIPNEVKMVHVSAVPAFETGDYDLLIVGGPTHGGVPSDAMKAMLSGMDSSSLTGIHVAAFDTRITWWWIRPFGYAAPKITRRLKQCLVTIVQAATQRAVIVTLVNPTQLAAVLLTGTLSRRPLR